jgi:hypothetical protein
MFAWLIRHQTAVLFFQNKPATSNQPAVLFFQNKSAPAISHRPNEQLFDLDLLSFSEKLLLVFSKPTLVLKKMCLALKKLHLLETWNNY